MKKIKRRKAPDLFRSALITGALGFCSLLEIFEIRWMEMLLGRGRGCDLLLGMGMLGMSMGLAMVMVTTVVTVTAAAVLRGVPGDVMVMFRRPLALKGHCWRGGPGVLRLRA